jgi:hypothetical protein
MEKEFLPYQESKDLKELGFNEKCAAHYLGEKDEDLELKWDIYRNMSINMTNLIQAPTYRQAFRFLREKYDLRYSIGSTNIVVCHTPVSTYHTTQLLQNNASYEDAELATIRFFIEKAQYYNDKG